MVKTHRILAATRTSYPRLKYEYTPRSYPVSPSRNSQELNLSLKEYCVNGFALVIKGTVPRRN